MIGNGPTGPTGAGLWIDDRYRGAHGIGRYAREVTSRLSLSWTPLGLPGAPADPLDSFRRLPRYAGGGLIYSPGYGAFLGARRQILTIHDLIHLTVDWPGRAKYLAYYNGPVRRAIRRAGVVLTVSETSKRAIEGWLRDDTVNVVNAGIGCSATFTPDGLSANAESPYLLYVGNLRAYKNVEILLDAIATAPGARLRAVIPSNERERAAALTAVRGMEESVEWLSDIDDPQMAALYRGAAATALPSLHEGFGLPVLESVMCATPVLYWAGCAAVAETAAGRGTAVDDARDVGAWRRAIEEYLGNRLRVVPPPPGSYSWDTTAQRVDATLREALTR